MNALRRRPVLLALLALGLAPSVLVGLTWASLLEERWLRFEHPRLAPLVSLVVGFVALRLLRLPSRTSPFRRVATELCIGVATLAAALAFLGTEVGRPLDRLAVLVAIDRSRSMDLVPDAEARVLAELRVAELGMRPDDRIGTLVFGSTAAVEDPLRERAQRPPPQRAEVARDGTDLGAAIRRALAEVPFDAAARVVLLTDGVNTRGDPFDAAALAVAAGVPIDVVPLDQQAVKDIRVVAVRTTPRATLGEPLELRVVTGSSEEAEVELRLYRNGELIRRGDVRLAAGEDVIRLKETASEPGHHRYEVQLTARNPAQDHSPEDNTGTTFVRVRGEAMALVLEGAPERAAPLENALREAAFRVEVRGPTGVPADLSELMAFDLVVLSDIPAHALAPAQLEVLATYVRELGGGLLLLGGDRSLGPGGYGKTPIEEISPVSFDIKQDRRRASLAEIIAIDYSGSMGMVVGGKTKLELANEAAVRSAELLGAGDRLGVMHVDTVVKWTVPLAPVTDQARIARAIRGVGVGGGGIYIDLTLREAYAALARETVNLKHLLLFADGDDAEERADAFRLIAEAQARGITTSVVALGRGSDVADLEQMSRLGKGRFYFIEDARRLPQIFAQETILASRSAIHEVSFRPELGTPGPPLRGVDLSAAPALTGYVVTLPKGRAQVLLSGPEGDPVLATWSIGIGRAGVFTSDYKDRWGEAWTRWSGAARLMGQLGRDLARREDDAKVRLEAEAAGGELHVRATVVGDDGRAESFRRLSARVGGPDGFRAEVPLEPVGAGAYAASVPLARPGAFAVTVVDELSAGALATTGAVLGAGDELRPTGSDRALLARLAATTGGRVRDTLAGVFLDRSVRRFAYRNAGTGLVWLSALALLLGVAFRRLSIPEHWASAPRRALERLKSGAGRRAPRMPAETQAALLRAKRERRERLEGGPPPPSTPGIARGARPPPVAERPLGADPAPPPPQATAAPPTAPAPAPGARPVTAAEILAARRRERRR